MSVPVMSFTVTNFVVTSYSVTNLVVTSYTVTIGWSLRKLVIAKLVTSSQRSVVTAELLTAQVTLVDARARDPYDMFVLVVLGLHQPGELLGSHVHRVERL